MHATDYGLEYGSFGRGGHSDGRGNKGEYKVGSYHQFSDSVDVGRAAGGPTSGGGATSGGMDAYHGPPRIYAFNPLSTLVPTVLTVFCQLSYNVLVFILPEQVTYFDNVAHIAALHTAVFVLIALFSIWVYCEHNRTLNAGYVKLHSATAVYRYMPCVTSGLGNGALLVILGLQGLFRDVDHAHDALLTIIRVVVCVESVAILVACSVYGYIVRKHNEARPAPDSQPRRKMSRKYSASSAGSHLESQLGPAHPDFNTLLKHKQASDSKLRSLQQQLKEQSDLALRLQSENAKLRSALDIEQDANQAAQEAFSKIRSLDGSDLGVSLDSNMSYSPSPPAQRAGTGDVHSPPNRG